MPTIHYYRFWCNTCKDFTLQWTTDDKACKVCGNVTETYKLSDVPKEKILEQRGRYKKAEGAKFGSVLGMFLKPENPLDEMFNETIGKIKITECDAGQKHIDEEREKELEKRAAEREELKKEMLKFKDVGRNDICPCGSGLKYKRCCLLSIK